MNVPSYEEHQALKSEIAALWHELRLTQQLLPKMLTIDQTCQAVNCSRITIHRLVKDGKLTPIYQNSKPLFPIEDIRAYIQSKRVSPERAGEMVYGALQNNAVINPKSV